MIFKTLQMQRVEAEYGEPIEDLLRRLYIDEARTLRDIAQVLGLSLSTISEYMGRCYIPTRMGAPTRSKYEDSPHG